MVAAIYTFVFALGACLSFIPTVLAVGLVQKPDLVVPPEYTSQKDEIRNMFSESYAFYKTNAGNHDNVSPLTKGYSNGRNGWGATIIDSMSTMKIMGLDALFAEAVDFVSTVDFSKSLSDDPMVSVFETTIRYLGGLLSAYELSDPKQPVLLQKAKQLGDKMAFSWVGTNEIPFGHINFEKNEPRQDNSNIAEAGTLTLEWATLSKYTGNNTYRALAEKSARKIASNPAPLPGLPAQGIDPRTGNPVGGYVTWGGGSDSYFEYLIKYQRLNNTADPIYVESWSTAVDSSIKTLLKTAFLSNWKYLADYDDQKLIRHVSSHLACFHGGNWLFGGQLLKNQTIVDVGLALVDSCWNTYASTSTGIGPEGFAFISSDSPYSGVSTLSLLSPSQSSFYVKNGFYITSSPYVLRPEVLESNFYAWRVTGDPKYLDRAKKAAENFREHLRVTGGGYAGLWDVDDVKRGQIDDTESFWYAEVLKYLYLTFDDPSKISLDKYVFNTEAHPFRVPPAPEDGTYGTGTILDPKQSVSFVPMSGPLPAVSPIPNLI